MRHLLARAAALALCSLNVAGLCSAARADELECAGVVETVVTEDGRILRQICHDSGGVTIPYIDAPVGPRAAPQCDRRSPVTQFESKPVSLQCCCPPGDSSSLVRVEAEYPAQAKQAGIEGWVDLEGPLTPEGRIEGARVRASSPKGVFDQAALEAFSRWVYIGDIEPGGDVEPGAVLLARICFRLLHTVSPRDTTVVAFVRPPADRREPPKEFLSAVDHLRSALADTAACLEIADDRTQLLETESVVVQFDGREFTFSASPASGVGAVLLSSEKPPQEVASPAGASGLIALLPDAAAAYFDAPRCKRDR